MGSRFEPAELAQIAQAAQSLGLEEIAQTAIDAAYSTANGSPVPAICVLLADIRQATITWTRKPSLSVEERILLGTLNSG